MNNDVAISIIIPFKVKEFSFLDELINCLSTYRGHDFEFIFVDDCADVGLSKIAKNKIYLLGNAIYIRNKKNFGVSYSRNRGIEASNGKYIMFVDSDDLIDVRFFDDLLGIVGNLHDDTLLCSKMEYFDNMCHFASPYIHQVIEKTADAIDVLGDYLYFDSFYDHYMLKSACGKLFCKKIIKENRLSFIERLDHYEDAFFVSEYCLFVKSAVLLGGSPFYFYRKNNSSASRSYDARLDQQITDYYCLFKTKCPPLFNTLVLDTLNLFVPYLILNCRSFKKTISKKDVDLILKKEFVCEAISAFKQIDISGCINTYLVRLQKLIKKTPSFVWTSYIFHIIKKYLLN